MREVRASLAWTLVLAVAAEFLLVRLLSRVGVYIPKAGPVLTLYEGSVVLGEVSFNLSLGLAILVLILAVWEQRPVALALLLVLSTLWMGPVLPIFGLLAGLLLLGARGLHQARPALRPGLGLLLLAQAMHILAIGLQRFWVESGLPAEAPGSIWLLRGAELLAALAPLAMAVGQKPWRRPEARVLGAAGAATMALGAALWLQPDLTGVLAMFSLGFSLSWPAPLYALALGAAVLACSSETGAHRFGLILLFLAGLGLNVNQQQVVIMAGWALLGLPGVRGEEERLRDAV